MTMLNILLCKLQCQLYLKELLIEIITLHSPSLSREQQTDRRWPCEIGRGLVRRPTAQQNRTWPCQKAHGSARSAVGLLEGPLPNEIGRGLVRRPTAKRDCSLPCCLATAQCDCPLRYGPNCGFYQNFSIFCYLLNISKPFVFSVVSLFSRFQSSFFLNCPSR